LNALDRVAALAHEDDLLAYATDRLADLPSVRVIGRAPVDKVASMQVARGGKMLSIDVTPRRRPMPSVAMTRERQRLRWQGLVLSAVPEHFKDAKTGDTTAATGGLIVVGMDESSPLKKNGIALGTVITRVAGKAVGSILDLQNVIEGTPQEDWKIETNASNAAMASTQEPAP